MQLSRALGLAAAVLAAAPAAALAEDRVDFTTTWYQERRGEAGSLTIIHPQLDLGIDLGENLSLGAGYASDVVTGATASVYSVDAVSTATEFDDVRNEGSVTLGLEGNRSSLSVTGGVGVERDYASISMSADAAIDLPGKNTNLALSYSHSFDEVCDRDNTMAETARERRALTGFDECRKKNGLIGDDLPGTTIWQDLDIDTAQATLTQNLTPTLVGQASLFGQVLQGFQENPYRKVRLGNNEPQENVPDVRGRLALMLRVNKYLEDLRAGVHASVRGYSDTWEVNSVTLEGGYSQYVGDSLLVRFRTRAYQQTAAKFFKDAFFYQTEDTAGRFFTGDRELAPLRNLLFGAKLTYIRVDPEGGEVLGVFDEVSFNLNGELLLLDELPADSTAANQAGTGGQFLNSGQILDAFILQLGMLMRY